MRYTVPGWPSTVNGHSAVTPHMNRLAGSGAQQYKDGVTGQPGTVVIPVDTAGTLPHGGIVGNAMMGLSRSGDSPDSFRPNLYFARPQRQFWPGAGMPISVRSDNLMPVPATDPRGIPARLARPIVQRGARQIQQPARVTTWPAWGG
jgi:hypothetical protein